MNFVLRLMLQGIFPCFVGLGGSKFAGGAAQNTSAAQNAVNQYGSEATAEGQFLNPALQNEAQAQHGLSPEQINEMLTYAGAGAGGATGGATGMIEANAARTGNATGVTKSLDEIARDKAKAAAGASEGTAVQDIEGAKQLNQQGLAGMQGLYGTNVGAQLKAMGQANADVQTQQELSPGWLKGVEGIVNTAANAASAANPYLKK